MIFFNDAVKWILRCLQDIDNFLFKQKAKNKQNFVKKIFLDYEYFGGLDVTNVLIVCHLLQFNHELNRSSYRYQAVIKLSFCHLMPSLWGWKPFQSCYLLNFSLFTYFSGGRGQSERCRPQNRTRNRKRHRFGGRKNSHETMVSILDFFQ